LYLRKILASQNVILSHHPTRARGGGGDAEKTEREGKIWIVSRLLRFGNPMARDSFGAEALRRRSPKPLTAARPDSSSGAWQLLALAAARPAPPRGQPLHTWIGCATVGVEIDLKAHLI